MNILQTHARFIDFVFEMRRSEQLIDDKRNVLWAFPGPCVSTRGFYCSTYCQNGPWPRRCIHWMPRFLQARKYRKRCPPLPCEIMMRGYLLFCSADRSVASLIAAYPKAGSRFCGGVFIYWIPDLCDYGPVSGIVVKIEGRDPCFLWL